MKSAKNLIPFIGKFETVMYYLNFRFYSINFLKRQKKIIKIILYLFTSYVWKNFFCLGKKNTYNEFTTHYVRYLKENLEQEAFLDTKLYLLFCFFIKSDIFVKSHILFIKKSFLSR